LEVKLPAINLQVKMEIKMKLLEDVANWKKIYEDLAKQAEATANQSKTNELKHIDEILNMISEFLDFCRDYVDEIITFSEQKNFSENDNNDLTDDVNETLTTYWKAISSAVEQHIPGKQPDKLKDAYKQLFSFLKSLSDRLENFNKEDVHIVLYLFEAKDSAKAIRFPFGSTRLIGIPWSDVQKEDWMSIPHELGHHVYWNARFSPEDVTLLPAPGKNFLQEEIDNAINQVVELGFLKGDAQNTQDIKTALGGWTEEIFADVVGAIIAGQSFINGAWTFISRNVKEKGKASEDEKKELFIVRDVEHPMDYLRPYIRHYATGGDDGTFINNWGRFYGNIDNYTKLVSNESQKATEESSTFIQQVVNGIKSLFSTSKDTLETSKPAVISISTLRRVMKCYVDNIVTRLGKIENDQLIKGRSSLKELKEFIQKAQSEENETELLMSLLTPVILEKKEYWVCSNGHTNSTTKSKCHCGAVHYWWNYIIP